MSLPCYSEYKSIGLEWLGEVPNHWKIGALKYFVKPKSGAIKTGPFGSHLKSEDMLSGTIKVFNQRSVIDNNFEDGDYYISEEKFNLLASFETFPGDLLITTRGTIGRCAILPENVGRGILHPCLLRVQTEQEMLLTEYLMALVQDSYLMKTQIGLMSNATTIDVIYSETMANLILPLPPIIEQKNILAFLDRETRKIDTLIAEQNRLLELLAEKVTSLVLSSINSTETQTLRLENAARLISRPVIQREDEMYTPIGLFNRGRGLFHKPPREMADMGDSDFFWIEEGDLIISGQFAWEGAVALAGKDDAGCVVSHRYPVLRGKPGVVLTEYLLALFLTKHGDFLFNENSRGAAGRNRPLNINSLLKEYIPVADMRTQEKVAHTIYWRNKLFSEISKQIELLLERRSALISAAVTGKIDVRNTA